MCYEFMKVVYTYLVDIEEGGGVSIAEQDAYLHVDMFKIDQVIRNLVSNAVHISWEVNMMLSYEPYSHQNRSSSLLWMEP